MFSYRPITVLCCLTLVLALPKAEAQLTGHYAGAPLPRFINSLQSLGFNNATDVALGDFDGDGDLDALVTNLSNEANEVWLNQGGTQSGAPGTFAANTESIGSSDAHGVALGDVDQDGDLDAVVANQDYGANTVWANDGAGNFEDRGAGDGELTPLPPVNANAFWRAGTHRHASRRDVFIPTPSRPAPRRVGWAGRSNRIVPAGDRVSTRSWPSPR